MNISEMMKQAQQLQSKMAEMQSELENKEIEGVAGAGMVRVTLNGKGVMRGIQIDPDLLQPSENGVLEDLILAAHNDAKAKVEQAMADEMASLTGGLPLPPGFKMPFM
jgi:DNA-binding YbaB/EbfC family protein